MVNLVKEAQESKKKIIMSAMVGVLVIVAAVPLFVVAGMFEMQVWTRVLLMGIGFVIMVIGIAIACVLDREAGAFECPECKERFVPDMKSYVMGPHTITKRKLTCPKCGCREYPKVCVNLQTDVRYNYSVWRLFLWQEEKTAHKKQQ